ncbi:MAG TPA: acyltransferase family protein, partial [Anaerolineae bacterium]|nr:acyltransferase family protein [Anaerolineae bacterium]
ATFSVFNPERWVDSSAPVVDASRWPFLDPFIMYFDTFMMSLLFLVSGLFTFSALERKGSKGFFITRLQRLGLPFTIGAILLAPVAFWPSYLLSLSNPQIPYLASFFTSDGWPVGAPWFLWVLLLFNGLVALANWKTPMLLAKLHRPPTILIIFLVTIGTFLPMNWLIPTYKWLSLGPFDLQPARIVLYFAYFLLGMALSTGQSWRMGGWPKHWGFWLVLGILSFSSYMLLAGNSSSTLVAQTLTSIAFAASCAGTSLGLLGVFRKLVRRHYPILDNLSANSFGIYLLHYPLVHWFQFALLLAPWPAWIKFSITFSGALALSWGMSGLLRQIPIVRRIL